MIQAEIKNLSKKYGDFEALKEADLIINKGEILAILGPSGCGKTTMLKLISGLEIPDSGEIVVENELVYSKEKGIYKSADKRNLAMVFQNYAIWPHKNVFENIAYPLKIKKLKKSAINEKVESIMNLVKLDGKEKRYSYQLSGGEKQRVALARALVMKPRLLLLDEPFSNLDAKLRDEMKEELKRIRAELDLTVIHVTHDQKEARDIADKLAVMNKGHILQVGSPEEVYENPKDDFIADFIM